MGVPILAVYIFLAVTLAPGLIMGGLNEMAVHFFIVYCALWAALTPPVATVGFVAAGVAGAPPMRTGFECMRLAVAKYLLPFFFVLSPAMVLQEGTPLEQIHVILTCFLGLIIISGALERYFWHLGKINIPAGIVLFAGGFLIALPGKFTDLLGAGVTAAGFGVLLLLKKRHFIPSERNAAPS